MNYYKETIKLLLQSNTDYLRKESNDSNLVIEFSTPNIHDDREEPGLYLIDQPLVTTSDSDTTLVGNDHILGFLNEDGSIIDSAGASHSVENYLNKITPQKEPLLPLLPSSPSAKRNENMQFALDELVNDACENMPTAKTSCHRRRLYFGGDCDAHIPKRVKIQKGEKCLIQGCKTYINHAKNFMRHLKQMHGERQIDGTFGLVRYLCQQKGCNTECLNLTNIQKHQNEMHANTKSNYKKIIYEIEENVVNQLKSILEKKN